MSIFSIKHKWDVLPAVDESADALSITSAKLQIFIAKTNITVYKSKSRKEVGESLHIPLYYLCEWIAENWWVLLFEPRKDENSDDLEYIKRHSIISAQHGFPLPALSIVPFGRSFRLNCASKWAPFANIKFSTEAFADASRDEVTQVLSKLMDDISDRLTRHGMAHSSLVESWRSIKSLSAEEQAFCELVGSLGLSPSEISDDVGIAIEHLFSVLGPRATRDFCLAANEGALGSSIAATTALTKFLELEHDATLDPLLETDLPPENYYAPSWRRGMHAARNLREKFKIDIKNPNGADIIFDALHIDTAQRTNIGNGASMPFSGAVDRRDSKARLALLQDDTLHRRFGAGRATYLAWVSEGESRRLVTNAVTRDQQASRSFSAEILIPQAYLKTMAGSRGELHSDQVREVAAIRRVMPDVAFKQAYNAGITIREI